MLPALQIVSMGEGQMKTLFIWWHRRRAAHHFAIRNNSWSVFHFGYDYHIAYMKFHEMQEERLLNE